MLKQSLSINPLTTHPDELTLEEKQISLSLGLIERNRENRSNAAKNNGYDFGVTSQEVSQKYTQKQFFEQILQQNHSKTKGRRLALIGPAGSGKTSLLHKIAHWIFQNTQEIPIWISLAELGKTSIREYLQEKWLKRAINSQEIPDIAWQNALDDFLNSGQVWLLLDGAEQIPLEQVAKLPITLGTPETRPIMLNPLSALTQQLRGWTDQTRLIITSNSYLWSVDKTILSGFDVFYFLPLTYPQEVKPFINQWFTANKGNNPLHSPVSAKLPTQKTSLSEQLAKKLCQTLEQIGVEKIEELCRTPLKLALLCRLWQQNSGNLPLTHGELYQQLIAQFYQWQAETVTLNSQQQEKLNQALGKLALTAKESDLYPNWLPHNRLVQELGEKSSQLNLGLRLGWLKSVGVTANQKAEKIYIFFDQTFQDYFAATAVQDWHFFLNHALVGGNSDDSSSLQPSYRIFSPQWQRIILLWLGRKDLLKIDKEAFLQALIEFTDGCSIDNFYGKRAYFLAVAGIAEFVDSQKTQEILTQLLHWSFLDSQVSPLVRASAKNALMDTNRPLVINALIQLLPTVNDEEIQQELVKSLEKIGHSNPTAIKALTEILATTSSDFLTAQAAESLGKIDPGNAQAISTLIQLAETTTNEEIRQISFNSLEKIGQGNFKAILALIRLLRLTESPTTQKRVFECIEKIGQGNATAIAALLQLIRTTQDENIRRQAAEGLEKIDPGNPIAITVLVQLVKQASNKEIRKQTVYSLGEITSGNQDAIEALVDLLSTSDDVFIRWLAISSLGKIGANNPQVIQSLINLIQSDEQALLRKDALESLIKLDPDNPEAVIALVQLMKSTADESTRREAAESLGKLDPGNPEAITALLQVLRQTKDEFTRRQVASSLGRIDPGNLEALKTLIQLVQSNSDEDIRSLAAESLGEIGSHNPAVLASLIRLTKSSNNPKTLRRAAISLAKIGRGNREAIFALVEMLKSREDQSSRLQAAESLITLLKPEHLTNIVSRLQEVSRNPQKANDLALQKILWHCVQYLPYSEFYQAWHNHPLYFVAEAEKTDDQSSQSPWQDLFNLLQNKIKEHPQLSNSIHLVFIDSNDFIDLENPVVDIYNLMLAQGCPEFDYGLPDTMAKLRLYWHSLRRNQNNHKFVLVFYDNISQLGHQGFSPTFLNMLSKFSGTICLITEQPNLILKQFSPKNSDLIEQIITWLEKDSAH
jgi:HEAT repeat protein/energy-coupling factor transporter ATP-binding protein EcfA2